MTTTRSMPWKRSSRASNTDPVHPTLLHARDKGPAPERSGRGFCRVSGWRGGPSAHHQGFVSSPRDSRPKPRTSTREQRTPSMNMQTTRRITAVSMASAATLAIAGFTALGSIFDYPKILKAPTDEILAAFRANQAAISGWFLVLAIGAALLAPVGILLGRIAGGTLGRWIAGVGIAGATVQVVGLS